MTGALHDLQLQLSPLTTSIILSCNKIQNRDILLLAEPGCGGEWSLNKCRVIVLHICTHCQVLITPVLTVKLSLHLLTLAAAAAYVITWQLCVNKQWNVSTASCWWKRHKLPSPQSSVSYWPSHLQKIQTWRVRWLLNHLWQFVSRHCLVTHPVYAQPHASHLIFNSITFNKLIFNNLNLNSERKYL